jgi:hypothetical protein
VSEGSNFDFESYCAPNELLTFPPLNNVITSEEMSQRNGSVEVAIRKRSLCSRLPGPTVFILRVRGKMEAVILTDRC